MLCYTCPEGGSVPVLVVMGKAGKAGHAAGVIISESLKKLPQLLPTFLIFHQPLFLIFGGHSTQITRSKIFVISVHSLCSQHMMN